MCEVFSSLWNEHTAGAQASTALMRPLDRQIKQPEQPLEPASLYPHGPFLWPTQLLAKEEGQRKAVPACSREAPAMFVASGELLIIALTCFVVRQITVNSKTNGLIRMLSLHRQIFRH